MKNHKGLLITVSVLAALSLNYSFQPHHASASQVIRATRYWNGIWHNYSTPYTVTVSDNSSQDNTVPSVQDTQNQSIPSSDNQPANHQSIKPYTMKRTHDVKKKIKPMHKHAQKHNLAPRHYQAKRHVNDHIYHAKHVKAQSHKFSCVYIISGSLIGSIALATIAYYEIRKYQKNNYYLNITHLTKTGRDSLIKTNLLNHKI